MRAQKQSNGPKKIVAVLATLLFLLAAGATWWGWAMFIRPNVSEDLRDEFLCLRSGSTLDDVVAALLEGGFIRDESSFRQTAARMKYTGRGGRFRIQPGWSNYRLIRLLRSGKQSPVKVILVNERLIEDVAGKVARLIEADSSGLLTLLRDPVFLDSLGYTPATIMSLFIPNTYEFYWNTRPGKFVERMTSEHQKFWEEADREAKARQRSLSKMEVYTLASIVERETNASSEMPRIAGLYLNRLRIGMPLQADPTLVFAARDWESRSLARHKNLDSPYNTYRYPGLPPGPISMASIDAIDAVLNAEEHKFLYMCSRGDTSGLHAFAETYEAHKVNIRRYRQQLIERGLGL